MKTSSIILLSLGIFFLITLLNFTLLKKPKTETAKDYSSLNKEITSFKRIINPITIKPQLKQLKISTKELNRDYNAIINSAPILAHGEIVTQQSIIRHYKSQLGILRNKNTALENKIKELLASISEQQELFLVQFSSLEDQINQLKQSSTPPENKISLQLLIEIIGGVISILTAVSLFIQKTIKLNKEIKLLQARA